MRQEYEWSQIEKHSRPDDLYLVINGKVYDVTTFQHAHPGGEDFLLDQGGKDVTELFNDAGHSDEARAILTTLQIGVVKAERGGANLAAPPSGKHAKSQKAVHNIGFWPIIVLVGVMAALFLFPNSGLIFPRWQMPKNYTLKGAAV